MLKIVYTKLGVPVSDFTAMEWAKATLWEYKPGEDKTIKIASEACLHAFELLVMRECIRKEEIEFYFENTKLEYDDNFGLQCPKGGWDSPLENIQNSILNIIREKYEERRMSKCTKWN